MRDTNLRIYIVNVNVFVFRVILYFNVNVRYGLKWDLEKCKSLLSEGTTIPEFTIGAHDKIHKFYIPSVLFGRDRETELLVRFFIYFLYFLNFSLNALKLNTFHKVIKGSSSIIFVCGHSGTGKTALIQHARQSLHIPRYFFISGKFDQV